MYNRSFLHKSLNMSIKSAERLLHRSKNSISFLFSWFPSLDIAYICSVAVRRKFHKFSIRKNSQSVPIESCYWIRCSHSVTARLQIDFADFLSKNASVSALEWKIALASPTRINFQLRKRCFSLTIFSSSLLFYSCRCRIDIQSLGVIRITSTACKSIYVYRRIAASVCAGSGVPECTGNETFSAFAYWV